MSVRSLYGNLPDALTTVLIAAFSVIVVYNAFHYPSVSGYDAEEHIAYARTLVTEWRIPTELRNYYTPPGFFLLAGPLVELGGTLGLSDVADLGQVLDGVITAGTAVLLAGLCAIVFPGRAWLRFGAVAFFVCCPIVLKTATMFHPEPLLAFLATLGLVLCARMLQEHRYSLGAAAALGVVVGAGQLVRSAGIWTLGVVCLALLVTAIARAEDRRVVLRTLIVVGALGILLPLPWYLYLGSRYGDPIFGRGKTSTGAPTTQDLTRQLAAVPSPAPPETDVADPSQRLWFYVDPGLPNVITAPYRGALKQGFWPLLYSDAWGDYFGVWKWGSIQKPISKPIENRLTVQAVAGIGPTFLAAAGFFALAALALARLRSRPELVLVPLMSFAAVAGTIYYAHSHPSVDGDTVKALFLLPAAPTLAIGFGFAAEMLGRRSRLLGAVVGVVVAVSLLLSLAFGIA